MKKFICLIIAITFCLSLTACGGCKHEWREANCTHPKTCLKCGKHSGEALGHDVGEWELVETDYRWGVNTYTKSCLRCGKVLDTKREDLESLHDGKGFLLTPEEFSERLSFCFNEFEYNQYGTSNTFVDDTFVCAIMSGSEVKGEMIFYNGGEVVNKEEGETEPFTGIVCMPHDIDSAAIVFAALVRALNPSMDRLESLSLAEKFASLELIKVNGITYQLGMNGTDIYLQLVVSGN